MLVRHAMTQNLTPETMKACSQNLGHANVMTTLTSYGQVPTHRQGELIRAMAATDAPGSGADPVATLEALVASMKAGRRRSLPGASRDG